jgi:inorganic pyrophosphatase
MPDLLTLPHQLDRAHCTARAIVETPKGHRSKFAYDPDSGLFALAGVLPAGMAFPMAFGFVPDTLAEDGDCLDIVVLADEDLPVGTLLDVRLLGVIEALQTERDGTKVRNDRLLGRPAQTRLYADVADLDCLGAAMIDELTRFFVTYNDLKGKKFEVIAIGDAERACALIAETSRRKPNREQPAP